MKYQQIVEDLKNKIYYPVYFLTGDEPYFIDTISDSIEESVLTDDEKEFNQTIVYGRDVDVPTIVSYAKRFPMMSNYQVVIVKEAQDVKGLETIAEYANNFLDSTILVLCYKYKKIDKRKSLVKNVQKNGVYFESKKLYENQIPDWISQYLKQDGYSITPKAALLITEFVGNDLSKVSNELAKLRINLPEGTTIDDKIIEENIGISKDFNVFELQKALGNKDVFKANQIINHFAANQKENPAIKVIGILYGYFSKLIMVHQIENKEQKNIASILGVNPYFVRDYQHASKKYSTSQLMQIISLLREYDLKSKGVGNVSADDGGLMKEMVFRILH